MNKKQLSLELKNIKRFAIHNKKLIPNNKINLKSMRLNELYQELYQLVIFGFANASIVMNSIFLETLLKEILFVKDEYDYKTPLDFGGALNKCEKYLTKKQYADLKNIKEFIRNPYQHHNIRQLTGGVKTKGVKLNVRTVEISEYRDIDSDELRPLEVIGKIKFDAQTVIPFFKFSHNISKRLSKKYL